MINKRKVVFLGFLFWYSVSYTGDSFNQEFKKVWGNPRDFFMYKESAAYYKTIKENGFKWNDLKAFAKTSTGKIFITYKVASTGLKGYFMYKAYQYVKPEDKRSDDIADYWDKQQWEKGARKILLKA